LIVADTTGGYAPLLGSNSVASARHLAAFAFRDVRDSLLGYMLNRRAASAIFLYGPKRNSGDNML
jgi:hypothetical protein